MTPKVSFLAIAVAAASTISCTDRGQSMAAPSARSSYDAHQGASVGFTDGWEDGKTVSFFYTKPFFCEEPPTSGAPSQCEIGEDGTVDPRPGKIPVLYVMTPIGFRPDVSTLQCPSPGACINHPSTIDLSRVFGPGFEDVLLPAHSHIIDSDLAESQADGGQAGWWEVHVIGVKTLSAWNQIVAGKSLATVRALQTSGNSLTSDILSNSYLFFSVRPKQ